MAIGLPHTEPPAKTTQAGDPASRGKLRFAIALLPDGKALDATASEINSAGIPNARMCVMACPAAAGSRACGRGALRRLDCNIAADGQCAFDVADAGKAGAELDAELAAYLLRWSQARQSQQLLQHLAHGGVALVVSAGDDTEQRCISDRLLQRSHIGVQTHIIRRR